MCVREVYDQSVLQFTINHKVCFALPRYTSRVIHRSKFSEYAPIPHPHAIRPTAVRVTAGTTDTCITAATQTWQVRSRSPFKDYFIQFNMEQGEQLIKTRAFLTWKPRQLVSTSVSTSLMGIAISSLHLLNQSSPPHEQWRRRFRLMLSQSRVNSTVSLNLAHVGSVADTSNGQPHEEKPIFQVLNPLVSYLYVGTLS